MVQRIENDRIVAGAGVDRERIRWIGERNALEASGPAAVDRHEPVVRIAVVSDPDRVVDAGWEDIEHAVIHTAGIGNGFETCVRDQDGVQADRPGVRAFGRVSDRSEVAGEKAQAIEATTPAIEGDRARHGCIREIHG